VILAHGFNTSQANPRIQWMATHLSRSGYPTFTFDFRGHGASGGISTLGDLEVEDLEAVARAVREHGHGTVVVIGASMGGSVAIRHAGLKRGVEGVIVVSAPSTWTKPTLTRARVMARLIRTRPGRAALQRYGTRVGPVTSRSTPPIELAPLISPIPVAVVHGGRDRYIPASEAHLLFDALKEPKRFVELPWLPHAEVGFTPQLADVLVELIDDMTRPDGGASTTN
jgi:pimeloyl-ACP methyl ester carboxylesterase